MAESAAEAKVDSGVEKLEVTNGADTKENGAAEAPTEKKEGAAEAKGSSEAAKKDRRIFDSRGKKFSDYSTNVKTDYDNLPKSEDHAEIRKQVEFYFSDSNLTRDKFLYEKVGGPSNNPVPLDLIRSFKRMRRFEPRETVIAALRDSKVLDIVGGDDGDDSVAIRRKTALKEPADKATQEDAQRAFEDAALARTVYVKGFGEEKPSSQFDIEAWFVPFGTTNQVRLRRDPQKRFKGSVFVEFDSEDTAKKFVASDPWPKYHGKELEELKSKKTFLEEKAKEHGKSDKGGKGGRKGKGNKNRDWRDRRDDDLKNGVIKTDNSEPTAEETSKKRPLEDDNAEESNKRAKEETTAA